MIRMDHKFLLNTKLGNSFLQVEAQILSRSNRVDVNMDNENTYARNWSGYFKGTSPS